AARLEEVGQVRRVARHHQRRWLLEAVDEKAALVVGGRTDGSTQQRYAAGAMPDLDRVQEPLADLRVIHALEEAKEAGPLAVQCGVRRTVDRGDAPERDATLSRQEELSARLAPEWVALAVEQLLQIGAQHRHETRIAAPQAIRQLDELAPLPARGHGVNL